MQARTKITFKNKRLGASALRVEDLSLLTGQGRYADDLPAEKGAKAIAFLRSPHAHARIQAIDVTKALDMPGVETIVTGADVTEHTRPFIVGVKAPIHQYALATDRVRYFGEPVCMVVADNRYLAEDAVDKISVEYQVLPATVSAEAAASETAEVLHEEMGTNIVHDRSFLYGDPDAAFERAAHVVSIKTNYPRNSATPIECFHVSARYNEFEDSYEVLANFQGPFTFQPVMARALGVPSNRFRLKTPPDSGGSFGVKQAIFPYIVACCVAARKSGKPVRWHEDRLEHLSAATSATNRIVDISAAVDGDGRIRAFRIDQLEDCGGYLRAPEPATLYRMHGNLCGAYDVGNLAVRNRVALTNKTPTGLVRGFGGPQLYFAIERLVSKISKELDIDPVELRKLNVVKSDQMPYRTASGALLDSGNYQASIERAISEGGYKELLAKRDAARKDGRIYGIGCAAVVEPSVSNMGYITALLTPEQRQKSGPKNGSLATATVAFDASGSITVNAASVPQGQGHRTVLAQVVAEVFDVDIETITVTSDHDTHKDAWSIASGNYSSRFAGAVAGAAHMAALKLREKITKIAASELNAVEENIEFDKGKILVRGNPGNFLVLSRVAASAHWSPLSMPAGVQSGLRETATWSMDVLSEPDADDRVNSSGVYGFIFDFCGVEIDKTTGAVKIDHYVTMHDAGKILNPLLADGQIRGGFAHGLGAALLEEFSYAQDGSFLTGTMADYLIPTACEVPDILILHDENPSPFTPLGAKGIAEGNCMSTPVCIANAVSDALGEEDIRLPLSCSKVSEFIHPAEEASHKPKTQTPVFPLGDGHGITGHGKIIVPATKQEVWNLLLDDAALARVIPGCHELDQVAPFEYVANLTLGVGPIKGRFEAKVSLKDMEEPNALKLIGGVSGLLGQSHGEGHVTLSTADDGTEVSYSYSILISGKAASIGGRMLDGATRSVINLFFKQLTAQLRPDAVGGFWRQLWARLRGVFGSKK